MINRRPSHLLFKMTLVLLVIGLVLHERPTSLIDFLVSPGFVLGYIAMLATIVGRRILADGLSIVREERSVREFIEAFSHIREPQGKVEYLAALTDVNVSPEVPPGTKASREEFQSSDLLGKLALVLQQARATVPSLLYDQGVVPVQYALKGYGAGRKYDASETADLVVRIALLGTFIGIIAALTIASNGLDAGSGSGANHFDEMQRFMQQLLATAAAKFWISASGLAGAIVLWTVGKMFQRRADQLRADLGRWGDSLLQSGELAPLLCKPEESQRDPIRDQLFTIAEQIKAAADRWVLTVRIGGENAPLAPSVELIQQRVA